MIERIDFPPDSLNPCCTVMDAKRQHLNSSNTIHSRFVYAFDMLNDLQKLAHFVEIARLGSYAAAADSLGVAQPTLTRSVQALERQLAGRLLDRGRNGAVPTALGEELMARAGALISQATKAEREMQALAGVGAGHVRMGAGAYPSDISIGLAAGRFSQRFPGVSIDVQVSDWT
jgi:DNA-binding transcriptional LysR family regulator